MKYTIITLIVALLAIGPIRAQDYDEDPAERQKVSVGAFVGVNAVGMSTQIYGNAFVADMGVGAEIALFTEYHINKTWGLRLVVAPAFERVRLTRPSVAQSTMATGTLDIALPLTWRLSVGKGGWYVGIGPCSRFVLGGAMNDGSQLPYNQQVGQDSITGEPRYAVDKFGSGFTALLGYERPSGLIVQADVRMGLTNILNTETYRGKVLPYKAVVSVGWRF